MATERNVVDFKIHNLTEEQFQELKAQGKIDPNAVYCTPDTTKERLDALENTVTGLNTSISAVDSNAVHKTGSETIDGTKRFNSAVHIYDTEKDASTTPTTNRYWGAVDLYDKNGVVTGFLRSNHYTNGRIITDMQTTRTINGTTYYASIGVGITSTGTTITDCPTPPASSNDTQIATTAWANAKFLPLAGGTLTGSLSIGARDFTAGHIELVPATTSAHGGFIDFHYAGSTTDYTSRIIENASGQISVTAANGFRINGSFVPSMPSGSYTSLTLGKTGTTYTAPADGWYCISKECTGSGQYLTMSNVTAGVGFTNSQGSGGFIHGFVPVRNGDTLKITYTANGTLSFFRFTYAEGAKHLA